MIESKANVDPNSSPIFEDLSLYKVIRSKQGRLILLHLDGSVSNIIPFKGINNTSMTEDDFERMHNLIQLNLDRINDVNVSIQFVMTRTNDVSSVDEESLETYLRPRAKFIKNLAENYQLFTNKFYLCLHVANRNEKRKKTLPEMIKKWILKKDYNQESYEKNMEGLASRVSSLAEKTDLFLNLMNEIGAIPKVLNERQEYFDILQEFTRPTKSKTTKIDIDQDKESPSQALFSGVSAKTYGDHFELDGFYHKCFMLDRAPKQVIFGKTIDVIESVEAEFIYSVTFRLMSNQESIDNFRLRMLEEGIKAGSEKDAIVPNKQKMYELEKVDQVYDDFVRGEGRGVSVCPVFILRLQNKFIEKRSKSLLMNRQEFLNKVEQDLVSNVFNRFGSSEWGIEENTQWMLYCHVIPGMSNLWSIVMKQDMLSTHNIPYFLAMYDNQRNNIPHNGTNHFVDMRGNLFKFQLKDPDLSAWNYSISGQTGSGKSVLINALLTMQFAEKGNPPVICILDVGGDRGSYNKFMQLVKGARINLSGSVKPAIPMFKLVPEMSRPTPHKIETLLKMILKDHPELESKDVENAIKDYYTMFLEQGGNNLTELKRDELFFEIVKLERIQKYKEAFDLQEGECEPDEKRMTLIMSVLDVILSSNKKTVDGFMIFDEDLVASYVYEAYRTIGRENKRFPRMTDFYNIVEEKLKASSPKDGEGNILLSGQSQKMLNKLFNWTEKGQYTMFDRESTLDISKENVILADLKGLESDKQLQLIYTMLISQMFSDKMYFIKDRRKVIIRDEAWSLMVNDKARQYFVEDLRTARKNGFVTISASQLPTDYFFPDRQAGKAIVSNMQVQIFCKFSSRSVCEDVAKEFQLPDEMVEELSSLGVQSETMPDGSIRKTYAKFMMIAEYGGKRNIYILKNLLHPFEYNLYSSSTEDNAMIDFYMKHSTKNKFSNLEDALWFITQRQHIGDEELYKYLIDIGEQNKAMEVKGKKIR